MLKNNFPNIKNIQLVVLSGGFGKRLGLLTKNNPKPLIVINKKPFLEYLVNYLVKQGFKKFLFLAGYKGIKIKKYLIQKYSKKKLILDFYIERKPMGTGYVLRKAKKKLDKSFFLINGDTYTNLNFNKFLKMINLKKLMNLCISEKKNKSGGNFFIKKNRIEFIEKPKRTSGLINCGIYYLNRKIIKFINSNKNSLEKDIIPEIIKFNEINLIKRNIELIDIGTFYGIKKFNNFIKKN